jgi:hypothetical protein
MISVVIPFSPGSNSSALETWFHTRKSNKDAVIGGLSEGHKASKLILRSEKCRKTLTRDPKDQMALCHLVRALRKTDSKSGIPGLLTQPTPARQATAKEEAPRNYKLVVQTGTMPPAKPWPNR